MKISTLEFIHNALQCEVDHAEAIMQENREAWLKDENAPNAEQLKHERTHWRRCLSKEKDALEGFKTPLHIKKESTI